MIIVCPYCGYEVLLTNYEYTECPKCLEMQLFGPDDDYSEENIDG
jgi:hypothetical protein